MSTRRRPLAIALIGLMVSGCDQIQLARDASQFGYDFADSTQQDTTQTDVVATRDADGRDATLLSAFFGIDNGLPRLTNQVVCPGAAGNDGMPVIFSHEIDLDTMQAGDFRVVSSAGIVGEIVCVTLAPANDPGEARTALLAGEFGDAVDQPVEVEIVGNLLSKDGQLNFRGARSRVTPLEDGPSMVWAEIVPEAEWELGKAATRLPWGGGDRCPVDGTKQVVRVTWAGGVTKPGGAEIDDNERQAYRVLVPSGEGGFDEIVPFALADLGDGDNNHQLCLDSAVIPSEVRFPAGLMTDPNEDLNPATTVVLTLVPAET